MQNYRNKMLRILSEIAAKCRCFNRFFGRKRVREFSIFNSPFNRILLSLSSHLPIYSTASALPFS